ncbi:MAG TPA: signal peptide peptidase SppA [Thermoanaerobaculia bacterium]|nr:signal peptide peptidase SppA [Thermoanaerobaculia bacterium]
MSDLQNPGGDVGAAGSAPAEQRPAGETPAAPTVVVKTKSRAGAFFLGTLTGCLVVFGGLFLLAVLAMMASGESSGEFSFSDAKVAIVPIEGEILDSREAIDTLRKYAKNDDVKAIVVRINSPGGAISPSQEIYSTILRLRKESKKPIIASLDSVAASGGFYIASACDQIVANPGSITGSIGVILQWFEVKDLVQWAKVKPETITSGGMKDAGSPFRDLTAGERQYFQRIVMQLHGQFVKAVAVGRHGKISEADIAKIADGRVFTGEEALALKLIDSLGTIDDAVSIAAKAGGIAGEPARIWPHRREASLLDLMRGDAEGRSVIEKIVSRRLPRFLYALSWQ